MSGVVGISSANYKEIEKTLKALTNTIEANYPDTFKSELRKWGFHEEKL
ncbi:MAG: hypothetical protein H7296_04985 [Bacteroidia bacterium]|nr:hypothetical protein [Bacteroidia bacterium]